MSHEVETMAYNQVEKPWHGLGFPVSNDLTPLQMMQASKTDWTVVKKPAVVEIGGEYVSTGRSALIRESDNKILDVISDDWNPTQNQTAFEFFSEYVSAGHMTMETAGSLNGGRNVWALAKIGQSFEAVKDDLVEGYLLFSNPHKYGAAINVRFTPIRVVCNNTLTFALESHSKNSVSVNHRRVFNPDEVKTTLGIATNQMKRFKETSAFLASKQFSAEDKYNFLRRVFPKNTAYAEAKGNPVNDNAELSKPAEKIAQLISVQPGANFAEGSFWQLFNAVTYACDHKLGRSADTRLNSAWFGINRERKARALNTAIEMAKAA